MSLYSQDGDETRLLDYLRTARGPLGSPLYDPQFALQVARQHGMLNACIQLLCELNLHEVRIQRLWYHVFCMASHIRCCQSPPFINGNFVRRVVSRRLVKLSRSVW